MLKQRTTTGYFHDINFHLVKFGQTPQNVINVNSNMT